MPLKIVCFGDSITEGAEFPEHLRWPSHLQAMLNKKEPDHYRIYNRGVGGDTTSQAFDRFYDDVFPLLPAMVLVQFGFNDANVKDWAKVPRVSLKEFVRNLTEFHRIINRWGGTCVFIINHTIGDVTGLQGNKLPYKNNVEPYNQAIRSLAVELDAAYIDLPELMIQRGFSQDEFLSLDLLHLSLEANEWYASMVYQGLLQQA